MAETLTDQKIGGTFAAYLPALAESRKMADNYNRIAPEGVSWEACPILSVDGKGWRAHIRRWEVQV